MKSSLDIKKSDLFCIYCGNRMLIIRDKIREKFHVKDVYCCICNHVTPHVEERGVDQWNNKKSLKRGIFAYYFERYGFDFIPDSL